MTMKCIADVVEATNSRIYGSVKQNILLWQHTRKKYVFNFLYY